MNDLIRRSDAENIFRIARKYMEPENYSEQEFFIRDNILLGAEQIIHSIPAVDAVEVVRGKWNHDGSNWENRFICDQCGYKWFFEAEEANFCPNCGADMREEG